MRGIIGRKFSSELGGIRQPITVLFTDVFGFTTMAESLDPEEVMAKTSRYFSDIGSRVHPVRRDHRQVYRRQRHGILERP